MSDSNHPYQKIASAVYLITSFFGDQEPLKWRLRSLSIDLTSDMVKDKGRTAGEIKTLIILSKNAGLVSDQNSDILGQALIKIQSEAGKPLELHSYISAPPVASRPERGLELAKKEPILEDQEPEEVRDKTSEEKHSLKEFGAVSVKKNNRQSIIIGLLKRKKEVMIKDISPLISGCSEKTIQRELSDMVVAGVLKKIGEKRWTRYTLA